MIAGTSLSEAALGRPSLLQAAVCYPSLSEAAVVITSLSEAGTNTGARHQHQQPVSTACTASSQHQHRLTAPLPASAPGTGHQHQQPVSTTCTASSQHQHRHPAPAPAPATCLHIPSTTWWDPRWLLCRPPNVGSIILFTRPCGRSCLSPRPSDRGILEGV